MNILKELIQRELTCENLIAYTEESTYMKNQIPVADGYDKLKPYGFPIHSRIEEYSRRVLWLKMTKWNSHAKVPAAYYVDTMKELGVCPKLLQTDCGTQNVLIVPIQSRLQASVHAHRYPSSVADIRIENILSYYSGHIIGKDTLAG